MISNCLSTNVKQKSKTIATEREVDETRDAKHWEGNLPELAFCDMVTTVCGICKL